MNCRMKNVWLSCLIAASFGLAGCGETPAPKQEVVKAEHAAHIHGDEHKHETKGDEKAHTHDGWWCDEHGVPEAECALCNSKVAADFQKKGDWCKDHDRPDSQCFKCHPEKLEEYAAKYEAKLGKKPPKPELN